ncbi:AraC family transcriptional regulator [Azospirillum agricola]|uniref:AraC family transcriptional regulator n=1 Tax=Azospirillum agricola TaxID=1720247 RepID=UPI000A0F2435|nr:AraC family transcriptional regulator [Azospirillum agricola]SMH43265.1 transcriptional regulator, AraC family [Azospirillum lipoferum]
MPNLDHFSLASIPMEKRLAVMKEAFWHKFQVNLAGVGSGAVSFSGSYVDLDTVSIFGGKSSPVSVSRGRDLINRDNTEYFLLSIVKSGGFLYDQRNRAGRVLAGNVGLFHHSEAHSFTKISRSSDLFLKIPCNLIRDRVRNIDDICAADLDSANRLLVPVVSQFASQLLKFDCGETYREMERVLVDLICLMLETRDEMPIDAKARYVLGEMTYQRLLAYMQDNFSDPELTPAKLAVIHHMSVSNLHRIFQLHGKTVSKKLMEIRLAEAHRLLTAPIAEQTRVSIGDVAYRCGFVNQAHFSTRFHEYFGVTPKSVAAHGSPLTSLVAALEEPL